MVLTGNGPAFCAGHDLKEMRSHPDKAYQQALFRKCGRMMMKLVELPQPVIARVHGMAVAAGCQLVAMCDLAVAVDTVKFAVSGVNLGLFCSTPAVPLSRNLPRKQAFEMLVTGEFMDASTACARGLVNRVVTADQLDAEVRKLTDSICAKSPAAVAMGKQAFYRQVEMGLDAAYQLAAIFKWTDLIYTQHGLVIPVIMIFIHKITAVRKRVEWQRTAFSRQETSSRNSRVLLPSTMSA